MPPRRRSTRDAPAWFHPGRSAALRLGPKIVLAHFGELHPETLRALDVAGPVAAFEVFLERAAAREEEGLAQRARCEAADLLPVRRDFAFVLDADVPAGDVVKAALAADKKLIAGVSVFDLFEGESLGAGKKSLALEVTLQPTDKTLTDEEIEAVAAKIVADGEQGHRRRDPQLTERQRQPRAGRGLADAFGEGLDQLGERRPCARRRRSSSASSSTISATVPKGSACSF